MQKPQLLVRNNHSFLKSTISVEEHINFALQNQHTHIFFSFATEINSFISCYKESKSRSLIPVCTLQVFYGCSELLLIAKNLVGYKNLLQVSCGKKSLFDCQEGLIIVWLDGDMSEEPVNDSSGCSLIEGIKIDYISSSLLDDSAHALYQSKSVFIRENKFLKKEDYVVFCLLKSIESGNYLDDEKHLNSHHSDDYLIQVDHEYSETQLRNLNEILSQCVDYGLENQNIKIDQNLNFTGIESKDVIKQLKEVAAQRLEQSCAGQSTEIKHLYLQRLNEECELIHQAGFTHYFLIVKDVVDFANKEGILLGIGRGSICGSLLAYLLQITHIDPIKYSLYFERFLNIKRKELPDIDVDIDSSRREELFTYLRNKYGKQHLCFLSAIQKYRFSSAIRDTARSLKIDDKKLSNLLKVLPPDVKTDSFEHIEILKSKSLYSPEIQELCELSSRLWFIPHSVTTHPAGIIISRVEVDNYLSFPRVDTRPADTQSGQSRKKDEIATTTQTAEEIQYLGFVKFDFLSLNFLELISKTLKKIEATTAQNIDIHQIDWDDKATYDFLASEKTLCLFQLEGAKITNLLNKFKPTNISELAFCISLIRPGSSPYIEECLAIRQGSQPVKYFNNKFESILSNTLGILIYQEQIMEIVAKVTNSHFSDADDFRKSISKKTQSILLDKKNWFVSLGKNNNYSEEELNLIWEKILEFTKYGFNKSHAYAYALMAYQTAWLKCNYTQDFYLSLFECFGFNKNYLAEITDCGYSIEHPTIKDNRDKFEFAKNSLKLPISLLPRAIEDLMRRVRDICESSVNPSGDAKGSSNKQELGLWATIYLLISNRVTKEEILLLNSIGYFVPLFMEGESARLLELNIDAIFNSYLMGHEPDPGSFTYAENDDNSEREFADSFEKYYGFPVYKQYITSAISKRFDLKSIASFSPQTKHVSEYVAFVVAVTKKKTKTNNDMYWVELAHNNYSSVKIACFLKGVEQLVNEYVAVSILNTDNFKKIKTIKKIILDAN